MTTAVPVTEGPTPDQIEYAKLMAVRQLIGVMQFNNGPALDEMIYRLTGSFEKRIILDENDERTPDDMAKALLVAVLMSALTTDDTKAAPEQHFAVLDAQGQVMASFASAADAAQFLAANRPPAEAEVLLG